MTGMILEITGIQDCLSVEFYIERDNSIIFKKDELVKVYLENNIRYFALIDADRLGRGHLMCAVEFVDREAEWDRPVVVNGFTGYSIPCMGKGNTIYCSDHEVSFKKVEDIPKNEGSCIYIGAVKDWVTGYEYITEDMVKILPRNEVEPIEQTVRVEAGDRFVVAIPYDYNLKAYKDNGFGGKFPFGTTVMGANGMDLKINDIKHKIYGEFITVDGELKIYIDE